MYSARLVDDVVIDECFNLERQYVSFFSQCVSSAAVKQLTVNKCDLQRGLKWIMHDYSVSVVTNLI